MAQTTNPLGDPALTGQVVFAPTRYGIRRSAIHQIDEKFDNEPDLGVRIDPHKTMSVPFDKLPYGSTTHAILLGKSDQPVGAVTITVDNNGNRRGSIRRRNGRKSSTEMLNPADLAPGQTIGSISKLEKDLRVENMVVIPLPGTKAYKDVAVEAFDLTKTRLNSTIQKDMSYFDPAYMPTKAAERAGEIAAMEAEAARVAELENKLPTLVSVARAQKTPGREELALNYKGESILAVPLEPLKSSELLMSLRTDDNSLTAMLSIKTDANGIQSGHTILADDGEYTINELDDDQIKAISSLEELIPHANLLIDRTLLIPDFIEDPKDKKLRQSTPFGQVLQAQKANGRQVTVTSLMHFASLLSEYAVTPEERAAGITSESKRRDAGVFANPSAEPVNATPAATTVAAGARQVRVRTTGGLLADVDDPTPGLFDISADDALREAVAASRTRPVPGQQPAPGAPPPPLPREYQPSFIQGQPVYGPMQQPVYGPMQPMTQPQPQPMWVPAAGQPQMQPGAMQPVFVQPQMPPVWVQPPPQYFAPQGYMQPPPQYFAPQGYMQPAAPPTHPLAPQPQDPQAQPVERGRSFMIGSPVYAQNYSADTAEQDKRFMAVVGKEMTGGLLTKQSFSQRNADFSSAIVTVVGENMPETTYVLKNVNGRPELRELVHTRAKTKMRQVPTDAFRSLFTNGIADGVSTADGRKIQGVVLVGNGAEAVVEFSPSDSDQPYMAPVLSTLPEQFRDDVIPGQVAARVGHGL